MPAAVAAYYRIFSGFAGWDDEGTFMMTVKQYLTGAKLYEEIYSGYGPVYYFYNWLIRSATGMAVDHNTVRITSAAVVVLCSLACAWIVLRLTQSLAAASVTHILVFRALAFFGNEPGHPQELCMLLLLALAASGFLAAKPRTRWLAMASAGSLAAALTLVKVNIGIFATLAVALAVLFQSPPARLWRTDKIRGRHRRPAAALRAHAHTPERSGGAGVLFRHHRFHRRRSGRCRPVSPSPGSLSPRECWAAAAGFAVTFALVLLALVGQGIPMSRVFTMLVLKHISLNVNQGALVSCRRTATGSGLHGH